MKYVFSADRKIFMVDLKKIYKADTKNIAEEELLKLDEKWGKKYPIVIKSWTENWEKLSIYFEYTTDIRKLIYTTNAVEGYHRQIRKVIKNKGVFPNGITIKKNNLLIFGKSL